MTWETVTIGVQELASVLKRIRDTGATITHFSPHDDKCVITYCCRTRRARAT